MNSMSMRFMGGYETGELGSLGEGVAALQILGFAFGGFMTYLYLQTKPYCGSCSKYYREVHKEVRYSGNPDRYVAQVELLAEMAASEGAAAAIRQVRELGSKERASESRLKGELVLQECPSCRRRLLAFETKQRSGNSWGVVDELSFHQPYESDGKAVEAVEEIE